MTIWHKRKPRIPVYYLALVSLIWAALWYADRKLAAYDRREQESIHCLNVEPAAALPKLSILTTEDLNP